MLPRGKKKKEGVNITQARMVQQCKRSRETKVAGGGKDRKSPSHLPWAVEEWVILQSATMLNGFPFCMSLWGPTEVSLKKGLRCKERSSAPWDFFCAALEGRKTQTLLCLSHSEAEQHGQGGGGIVSLKDLNQRSDSSHVVKHETAVLPEDKTVRHSSVRRFQAKIEKSDKMVHGHLIFPSL